MIQQWLDRFAGQDSGGVQLLLLIAAVWAVACITLLLLTPSAKGKS